MTATALASPSSALTTATTAGTTATRASTAPVFGPATRVLMGLVFAGPGALGPRRMGTFRDFELGRLDEIDLALEQLLDVTQVADFIG